jgi:hypothetical protein
MKKITLLFTFLFAAFSLSAQTTDSVTFRVDMAGFTGTIGTSADLNGTFNAWCGACNQMSDADGDGVWEITLALNSGTQIEYKFTVDGWTSQENLTPGDPCVLTTSGFTNRVFTPAGDTILPVVCWESCSSCGSGGGGGATNAGLPLTFSDTTLNHALTGFGGANGAIVVDPTDPNNNVLELEKTSGAQTWGGVSIGGGGAGLASPFPFSAGNTIVTMRVWSPTAGTPFLMKVEDKTDPTISVEVSVNTTQASTWETLSFDFSQQVSGTAAINFANTYDMVSVFPDFGTSPTSNVDYYVDDIMMMGAPVASLADLPLTFTDTTLNHALTDFGGAMGAIVVDPTDPNNNVLELEKGAGAQTWGGVSVGGGGTGLANPFPFNANATKVTMRVWSPTAGTPFLMKVEDKTDPTISVEVSVNTTQAGAWDTLTFDFTQHVSGTSAINFANTYDMVSVFPNFGTSPTAAETYYVDDIMMMGSGTNPNLDTVDLPITFDDPNVNYGNTAAFGGCGDTLMVDPTDPTNNVMRIIKSGSAETWGGIVVTAGGMKNKIPFTATETGMTMRVWSPDAGTDFLLKVEDATDATISAETIATTTMAGAWETLSFDLSNTPTGTPAFDPAANYDVVVVFPNFGTPGIAAGAKTYYIDDIEFDANVGISEASWAQNWTLAPNPSNGLVRLEGLNGQDFQVVVTDLNGRSILKANASELNNNELNLSMLNNGIYLITVANEFYSESRKLIITK